MKKLICILILIVAGFTIPDLKAQTKDVYWSTAWAAMPI